MSGEGSTVSSKVADSLVGVTWGAYFLSHIDEINKLLQTLALILAIIASACAIRFHTRKKAP